MYVLLILSAFALSALLASLIIPRIILIAMRKRLFDIPDERKVHTKAIPRLGGVAFFPIATFSLYFLLSVFLLTRQLGLDYVNFIPELLLLVCGMTALYLTGLADDLLGVRYRSKFMIQVFCAALLPLSGVWINSLYGLFGIYGLPALVGIPLTMFMVVFITNAINLIDGIDGLASGLSSVALLILSVLFFLRGNIIYPTMAMAMLGVLVSFFYYNVFGSAEHAKKIFMGDTGSLTLGYMLSFMVIKYSHWEEGMDVDAGSPFLMAFSTLIIPAFDVVRVVLVRLRNGQSPFLPDRNHIHHKLLDMGLTTRRAMVLLLCMAGVLSVGNILLMHCVGHTLLLVLNIVLWIGINLYWDYLRDKRKGCGK